MMSNEATIGSHNWKCTNFIFCQLAATVKYIGKKPNDSDIFYQIKWTLKRLAVGWKWHRISEKIYQNDKITKQRNELDDIKLFQFKMFFFNLFILVFIISFVCKSHPQYAVPGMRILDRSQIIPWHLHTFTFCHTSIYIFYSTINQWLSMLKYSVLTAKRWQRCTYTNRKLFHDVSRCLYDLYKYSAVITLQLCDPYLKYSWLNWLIVINNRNE